MGLDMYLNADHYVSDFEEAGIRLANAIKVESELGLGAFRPKNVTYELMYWRKANAIHNWFVNNVQEGKDDCRESYVSLEKLTELRDICDKILLNPELGAELLPTTQGFFFGSREYDEWYLQTIARTAQGLTKILDNPDAKKLWITYSSSW
jgi:hypothetical protein